MGCIALQYSTICQRMSKIDSMDKLSFYSPNQWAYVFEIMYPPILLVTKISICVQLQRLLVPLRNKTYWAVRYFIWINMSYYTCVIFITVFQCKPIDSIWDAEIKGSCLDNKEFILATAVSNLVTNIVIRSFPFFKVSMLHMSTKKKLNAMAVFLLGPL